MSGKPTSHGNWKPTITKFLTNLNYKSMKSFIKFHEVNPKIYTEFQNIASIYIARGERRIKSDMICEIIRFQLMKEYNDSYKFIKYFASDYGIKFEADFPQHAGVFTKRLVNFELDD